MGMNVVCLMGRMTADAELHQTTNGKKVTSFTLAVDKYPDGAYFINCVAWEKNAEFISKYFGKGAMIAVQGELTTRSYEDKNGNNRTAVEVVVRNSSFCGGKSEGAKPADEPVISAPKADSEYAAIDDSEDWPF